MVLGMKAKNRRSGSIQIDYLIHLKEIKPWPPTQSLRSLRSVLIQWKNGESSSGCTKLVSPSLGSVIGEGKIEFNESVKLSVTLLRDVAVRGGDADVFQKNLLDLNLYEPRREKSQLLASGTIDLANFVMHKERFEVTVPMCWWVPNQVGPTTLKQKKRNKVAISHGSTGEREELFILCF
ncbi:hypothetical protein S83_033568 [Arachis hypogaea]